DRGDPPARRSGAPGRAGGGAARRLKGYNRAMRGPWLAIGALALAACGDSDGGAGDLAAASDGSDAALPGRDLSGSDSSGADLAAPSDGGGAPVYPLKVGPNGRYLVDQSGAPFLIAGDAPQSLIVNLSPADADSYFADRAAHGFNTVW